MKMFQGKEANRRSIDEILTPKNENQNEGVCEEEGDPIEENDANVKSQTSEEFTNNALNCFGWKDVKTEKWLIKSARIWYGIASFGWFLLGAVTFAPIIFMSNKVNVIFKNNKKSLICGIIIYAILIALLIIVFSRKRAQ